MIPTSMYASVKQLNKSRDISIQPNYIERQALLTLLKSVGYNEVRQSRGICDDGFFQSRASSFTLTSSWRRQVTNIDTYRINLV